MAPTWRRGNRCEAVISSYDFHEYAKQAGRGALTALFCALASCGSDAAPQRQESNVDPMVADALDSRLMTDPDMALLNEGNSALRIPTDTALPQIETGPDEIERIRRAIRLEEDFAASDAVTAPVTTQRHRLISRCKGASYRRSATLVMRLPDYVPIVPRGAVVDARELQSGSPSKRAADAGECARLIVDYQTPLPLDEAMAYHQRQLEKTTAPVAKWTGTDADKILQMRTADQTVQIVGLTLAPNLQQITLSIADAPTD